MKITATFPIRLHGTTVQLKTGENDVDLTGVPQGTLRYLQRLADAKLLTVDGPFPITEEEAAAKATDSKPIDLSQSEPPPEEAEAPRGRFRQRK